MKPSEATWPLGFTTCKDTVQLVGSQWHIKVYFIIILYKGKGLELKL